MLLDRLFNGVQEELVKNIDFLDYAYGKAERVVAMNGEGTTIHIPAIYKKGKDYESLLPDDKRGNYCFFVVEDNQNFDYAKGRLGRLHGTCALIVWLDQRTMSNAWCKEYAKSAFLAVLSNLNIQDGHLQVTSVAERAETIFRDFSLTEIDNQYLTYPFCGFRFNCDYSIKQNCDEL